MKAKEFIEKFELITANNPGDRAFLVNAEAINEFAYDDRLVPHHIEYTIIDDYTIEAKWITYEWSDDIESLVNEITRYANNIATKVNLEEDVLLILRIKSKFRDTLKSMVQKGHTLNDLGNSIVDEQHLEYKIIIKAAVDTKNTNINLIDISKCKVYTLDGMNIHWWYQTTGKNYSRAALFIEKDGSYSINRDDLGSEARLISIGAKTRGDGNSLWSGYHKEGPVKCYKLKIDTQFKMDCYIDIDTLKNITKVDKSLFEIEEN